MTFDFAGSGISEGEFISLGVHEIGDIEVCVNYLKKEKFIKNIGL